MIAVKPGGVSHSWMWTRTEAGELSRSRSVPVTPVAVPETDARAGVEHAFGAQPKRRRVVYPGLIGQTPRVRSSNQAAIVRIASAAFPTWQWVPACSAAVKIRLVTERARVKAET